jgi:hypothetical protein
MKQTMTTWSELIVHNDFQTRKKSLSQCDKKDDLILDVITFQAMICEAAQPNEHRQYFSNLLPQVDWQKLIADYLSSNDPAIAFEVNLQGLQENCNALYQELTENSEISSSRFQWTCNILGTLIGAAIGIMATALMYHHHYLFTAIAGINPLYITAFIVITTSALLGFNIGQSMSDCYSFTLNTNYKLSPPSTRQQVVSVDIQQSSPSKARITMTPQKQRPISISPST